jgi:threonine aldolase
MSPLRTAAHSEKPFVYDMVSDTATIPSDEMFDIMKAASRGDDVYQVKPSTRKKKNFFFSLTKTFTID